MSWISFAKITDGPSNTIMIVEVNDESAIVWTKPGDFNPEDKAARNKLVSRSGGRFYAAFVDGSVRPIRDDVSDKVLLALCTRAGGERVDPADVNRVR